MSVNLIREQDKIDPEYITRPKERMPRAELELLFERNINAKKEVAPKLVDMGLSENAVKRVLHLEGELIEEPFHVKEKQVQE